jgi:import inner membrane translocase subunit TIM17
MGEYRLEQAPCPWRVIDDVGGAFAMGAVGGGLWYAVKGFRNAPKGDRLIGSVHMLKMRSPVLAGNFAVWGGFFSTYDCAFMYMRGKEDPWNAIASGAATGATLAVRAGWKTMLKQGAVGGVFLGLIEGLGILISKVFHRRQVESMDFGQFTPYDSKSKQQSKPIAAPSETFVIQDAPDHDYLGDFTEATEFVFEDDFGDKFQDVFDDQGR